MKRTAITTILCLGLGALGALALLLLLGGSSHVTEAQGPDDIDTYYVAPGGSCGTGIIPCYASVQDAVDAADASGDVIKVAAGTYTGTNNYGGLTQSVYLSKTVTIRGGYTTTNWAVAYPVTQTTTLHAQSLGRVLYITGDISPTVEGFRITGGNAAGLGGAMGWDGGGGVYVNLATATIRDNRVFSNTADWGGGLYLLRSDAKIVGNTVMSNSTRIAGGGLFLEYSPAEVSDNAVLSNTASAASGIYSLLSDNATLSGNTISYNDSWGASAVYVNGSDITLTGNDISYNPCGGLNIFVSKVTVSGNTIVGNAHGGLNLTESDATVVNNLVADNGEVGIGIARASVHLLHNTVARNGKGSYSGVSVFDEVGIYSTAYLSNTILVGHTTGVQVSPGNTATLEATLWGTDAWSNGNDWGGGGTIITGTPALNYWGDPAFVDPDNGNYHISASSVARDAGIDAGLAEDADGDPRPMGHGYDLGADEFRVWIAVRKTATPSLVQAGEQVTYTLYVTNTGDVDVHATISDVLPVHVTPTGVLTWTPTITAPGGVWEQAVVVTVEVGYTGLLTNIVRVTSAEGASGVYTETAATPMPALTVTKRANANSVQAGEQLTYTIQVTNTGNVDLHATVTDVLPSHVTPTGVLTWTPTISAPGGVWEQTVVVTVETGYSGVLTNTVQVTTEEGASDSDTETCTSIGGYYIYLPLILRQY
jgi:uncharacterized repeat protein (TIGR01451 family)